MSGIPESVVIVGGGPGGYEAALVAAQFGADVTVIESGGIGGAAVLTDCVPSKTLIATSDRVGRVNISGELGIRVDGQFPGPRTVSVDLELLNKRVLDLAAAQSEDIAGRLRDAGVHIVEGHGRLVDAHTVAVGNVTFYGDVILLATEQRDLLPPHDDEWALLRGVEPCQDPIHPWPPESARLAFLQRYHELTRNKETAV